MNPLTDIDGQHGAVPSAPNASPNWPRLLVPSVADLICISLLVSLAISLARRLLEDAGIGWHIRTGELILRARAIPRVDSFSSLMNGKQWYAWEWLYDLVIGGVHRVWGLNGVVACTALVIAITFTLVFRMMRARGANLTIAVAVLLLSVSASSIHFLARPHVVSWLLTVIWFGVLDTFERDGNARRLLWLPATMLLWVNVHGGFLVGFVLLGIYGVGALARGWRSRGNWRDIRMLTTTAAAAFAMTFVNPYTYHLHVHIYQYLTDPFLMNHINEFLSPDFHGVAQKCFVGLFLLVLLSVAATGRLSVSQLLVTVFAVYSGLYSGRNIPVSSMLLALIVAPQLSALVDTGVENRRMRERLRRGLERFRDFSERMGTLDAGLRGHVWVLVVLAVGMWTCAHGGRLGSRQIMNAGFDDKRFPIQAVDFLSEDGVHDPVFCPDYWGGYLIYRLYPQMQVAVDDRHDLYGTEFVRNYLKVLHVEPGWREALDGMQSSWVLFPKDAALTSILKEMPQWKVVYHDETAVLFRKTD